jgi:hypothetical protein
VATQGSPLTPEFKRALVLLKGYFDRTQDDLSEQACSSVQRTAHALEVGVATVKRVMADYHRNPALIEGAVSLRRGHRPRALADSLQTITRDYVRQANREGVYITLEMVADYLKEEGGAADFSVRTLGRALDLRSARAPVRSTSRKKTRWWRRANATYVPSALIAEAPT